MRDLQMYILKVIQRCCEGHRCFISGSVVRDPVQSDAMHHHRNLLWGAVLVLGCLAAIFAVVRSDRPRTPVERNLELIHQQPTAGLF